MAEVKYEPLTEEELDEVERFASQAEARSHRGVVDEMLVSMAPEFARRLVAEVRRLRAELKERV